MIKSRIIWILWILTAFIFWFFTKEYSGVLLLAASFAVPLFMGLLTRFSAKNFSATIHAQSSGAKHEVMKGAVIIKNAGLLFADRIVCTVKCENLMTGEVFFKSIRAGVPGKATVKSEFEFRTVNCGNLRLSVPRMTIYDSFGIFRFRIIGDAETRTFIRPDTFPLEVQIVYGESMSLDSDEYSMQKAGFDPSETFAIREYIPGDRIKQIHWKLSEKMGNLMVREYGLPIQNTIMLLLETGKNVNDGQINPECMDALGESVVSLSQELIQQQIVHSLGWFNHEDNCFTCTEITCQEELMSVMPQLLGTVPMVDEISVLGHYLELHEQCEFAHIAVFSPYHISDVAAIEDRCLVTEILCVQDGGEGYSNDGSRILSVNPKIIAEELAYIEI